MLISDERAAPAKVREVCHVLPFRYVGWSVGQEGRKRDHGAKRSQSQLAAAAKSTMMMSDDGREGGQIWRNLKSPPAPSPTPPTSDRCVMANDKHTTMLLYMLYVTVKRCFEEHTVHRIENPIIICFQMLYWAPQLPRQQVLNDPERQLAREEREKAQIWSVLASRANFLFL